MSLKATLAAGLGVWLVALAAPPATALQPEPPFAPFNFPPANKGKELIPDLIKALKDDDAEVRKAVADALANLGQDAVPGLLTLLKSRDPDQRAQAAQILGQMGWQGQDALPALLRAVKDKGETREVRRSAARAISQIVKNP